MLLKYRSHTELKGVGVRPRRWAFDPGVRLAPCYSTIFIQTLNFYFYHFDFHSPRSTHLVPLTSFHSPRSTHLVPLTSFHSPRSTHLVPLTSFHSPRSTRLVPLASFHSHRSTRIVPLASFHSHRSKSICNNILAYQIIKYNNHTMSDDMLF